MKNCHFSTLEPVGEQARGEQSRGTAAGSQRGGRPRFKGPKLIFLTSWAYYVEKVHYRTLIVDPGLRIRIRT